MCMSDLGRKVLRLRTAACSLPTLQGTNMSHPGKRNIIFKKLLLMGFVSSLEGNIPCKTSFFSRPVELETLW